MKRFALGGLAELSPSYFSLVMATGIISIGMYISGFSSVATTLFYFNVLSYFVLVILFRLKMIRYSDRMLADFRDNRKNMGFLTFVAASCILGNQFVVLFDDVAVARCFLAVGLVSWIIFTYALFTMVTVKSSKPSLDQAISGVWLLMVVSTQAVSVLSGTLAYSLGDWKEPMLFLSMALFLCGCMLYLIIITLVVYRMTFFELEAEDFAPPYWINMGAVAITTLAGCTILEQIVHWEFLQSIEGFITGFSIFFWSFGTWWIPLMIIFGVWRHIYNKLPLRYHSQYWGMVFPLGMYSVCTIKLSQVLELSFLLPIGSVFIYLALAAWGVTFFEMIAILLKYPESRT